MKATSQFPNSRSRLSLYDGESVSKPAPAVIHLAGMIDFKEAKLERTLLPFQRKQLAAELEALVRRFQIEYRHFAGTTGDDGQ